MTTTAIKPAADETLRSVLAAHDEHTRPGAVSASLTFGWRALLRLKHDPQQVFDALMFPIMFTLMFTYLFGGALAGSTHEYLQFFCPAYSCSPS
jgi:ABC-2 type transport system permease protein